MLRSGLSLSATTTARKPAGRIRPSLLSAGVRAPWASVPSTSAANRAGVFFMGAANLPNLQGDASFARPENRLASSPALRVACPPMSNWEYKVISSGKGGFASPALMEKFLNDRGQENWEIVSFHQTIDNALAFHGLARRTTLKDWTLEDAVKAAARAEADKLRAEFEAKFKAGSNQPGAAAEEEGPTFFDALRPHMRRNQRGPGMSVGLDHLAKKWHLEESDLKGALVECGLSIPVDENAKPGYVEYEGELYWVNINRRGEIWINLRDKPQPVFRIVQGKRLEGADEPVMPAAPRARNARRASRRPSRRPTRRRPSSTRSAA